MFLLGSNPNSVYICKHQLENTQMHVRKKCTTFEMSENRVLGWYGLKHRPTQENSQTDAQSEVSMVESYFAYVYLYLASCERIVSQKRA